MKISAKEFTNLEQKSFTLLGMSGVGKTHLAKLLSQEDEYYHYSGDYRIGSKYLNSQILNNITERISKDEYLKNLLDDEAISVSNHITFDNLSSVSNFLGKVGNPEQGGIPLKEFKRRQNLHREAEVQTMLDVPEFINKANTNGVNNFINDAGGSLCELDDDNVYQTLANNSIIVYIKASDKNITDLVTRAKTHPKPLYYQPDFLDQQLEVYLTENNLTYVAQINPDEFVRWIFTRLLEHRVPKYENIASKYGYTIDSEALYKCKSSKDVLELIAGALD